MNYFLVFISRVALFSQFWKFSVWFLVLKWQKVAPRHASRFAVATSPLKPAADEGESLFSLHAVATEQRGGGRRRSTENRSHRSGAVSDPRKNPGGASVQRSSLITPACLWGRATRARVRSWSGGGGGAHTHL